MQNRESLSKPSRIRRIGIATAGFVVAGAAGLALTSITNAHAAEFVPVFIPTAEDPTVSGNGIGSDFNEAQALALDGLSSLCRQAGYFDVAPGVQTNAEAAASGQSKTPEGDILFTAIGVCAE